MKRIKHVFTPFIILVMVLSFSQVVMANVNTIANRTFTLESDELDYEKEQSFTVSIPKKSVLQIRLRIKNVGDADLYSGDGVRVQLFNSSGNRIQNDFVNLYQLEANDTYETWLYNDGLFIDKGQYTYKVICKADYPLRINAKVIAYTTIAKKASIKTSVSTTESSWVKVGKIANSQLPLIKKFTSSTKNALFFDIEANGNVWIYANKIGTFTATFKLRNGKTYKCKVKVKTGNPNFFADVYGYITRDNYFIVRFKNNGKAKLTIHSSGAYSMDADYKSYDRNLYISGGSVTVNPGKTKKIKFKVEGRTTWPNYKSHTVRYYFTYGGKKYLGSTWYKDSVYKKGKKWYNTYWNSYSDAYLDWLY